MRRRTKMLAPAAVAALLALVVAGSATPASGIGHRGMSPRCAQETVSVQLAEEDPQAYEIVGWLCWRGRLHNKTVQVLLPGISYDHHYWDFPYRPRKYSYVRTMTRHGYATFNVDRIGIGLSDRPDPYALTVPAQAYIAQQVVQKLRAGEIAGAAFDNVIGVGHSFGAAIWMVAAGTYPDNAGVDGLMLANFLHDADTDTQAALAEARHPAGEDPKFADLDLPEGYLATKPDTRHLYYYPQFADPRVIKTDERLKQTSAIGEFITLSVAVDPTYTRNITVPTLLVVGENDTLFCNPEKPGLSCADEEAVMAREAPHYSAEACLEVLVLPRAGHDTNLHYNARRWFNKAHRWADRQVGWHSWYAPWDRCG